MAALESGKDSPSRPLLSRMAKQYRRPLVTFYLATPPKKGDRGQDFRTLPQDHDVSDEVLLDALLRDVRARQGIVRAALEDEGTTAPLPFIGSLTIDRGVDTAVDALRLALEMDLSVYRATKNSDEAFRLLRDRVEALKAFVLLVGDLGSHHTALNLETFRGMAIADAIAPFVVINDQDSRAAWSFSLIHELTHIFLGQTGVSGGKPDRAIEKFCDGVAAEFLLPTSDLVREFRARAQASDALAEWISTSSARWKVSRTMIAYRLFVNELISESRWRSLRDYLREQWLSSKERQKVIARERGGGPSYYVLKRQRLGDSLLTTASRLLSSGVLSTSKVARVLAVKPTNVGVLLGIEAHAVTGE
jgi:Zn-dependent peptidase ImmA (M78 family)